LSIFAAFSGAVTGLAGHFGPISFSPTVSLYRSLTAPV
jgi:hypothetical protein